MQIKDRMIYLVVSHGGTITPERNVSDLDRATTIKDIAEGQFTDVVQVLEMNPTEGTCRDVTEEILRAAWPFGIDYNDFQAWLFDHKRDYLKHEAPKTDAEYANWRWTDEREHHNVVVL
jgi:hypothetical protein